MAARILLYSGKGGVGKTTLSAATGMALAAAGQRVLVMSTDPAHSLGDVFDVPLGNTAVEVQPNLFARELYAQDALEGTWDKIGGYIERFLASQGLDKLVAAEIAQIPGMHELLSLLELARYEHVYDVLILDCAPTGSTISLLALPEAARWYMERFFKAERTLLKAVKPVAERLTQIPLPEDDVFGQVETLYNRIKYVSNLLQDSTRSSIRLVGTPEAVVLAETRRALAMFHLHKILVDAIIINRVFPAQTSKDTFLAPWREAQQANLISARSDFAPVPLQEIPFQPSEVQGPDALELLVQQQNDWMARKEPLYTEEPVRMESTETGYAVSIHLPADKQQDVRLWMDGDDLVFLYRGINKRIALPQALRNFQVEQAYWQGTRFVVSFSQRAVAGA